MNVELSDGRRVKRVEGLRVSKMTSNPPTKMPGDSVLVAVKVRVPKVAFDPQTILATIPVEFTSRPVEIEVVESSDGN